MTRCDSSRAGRAAPGKVAGTACCSGLVERQHPAALRVQQQLQVSAWRRWDSSARPLARRAPPGQFVELEDHPAERLPSLPRVKPRAGPRRTRSSVWKRVGLRWSGRTAHEPPPARSRRRHLVRWAPRASAVSRKGSEVRGCWVDRFHLVDPDGNPFDRFVINAPGRSPSSPPMTTARSALVRRARRGRRDGASKSWPGRRTRVARSKIHCRRLAEEAGSRHRL